MGIKITPADHWCGYCLKEGRDWTCERCGKQYPPKSRGIEQSHYFGRKNHAVRYNPLNVFILCTGCHRYFTANPHCHTEWVKEKLGAYSYDLLVELSNDSAGLGKRHRREQKEIAKYYKQQYEEMLLKRSHGKTGRIEVIGY